MRTNVYFINNRKIEVLNATIMSYACMALSQFISYDISRDSIGDDKWYIESYWQSIYKLVFVLFLSANETDQILSHYVLANLHCIRIS